MKLARGHSWQVLAAVVASTQVADAYINYAAGAIGNSRIYMCDLDGANDTEVTSGRHKSTMVGVAVHPETEMIYYTDQTNKAIFSVPYSGTPLTKLVDGLTTPKSIVYNHREEEIYWTDTEEGILYKANSDGSNVTALVTGYVGIWGLTTARMGKQKKLYFTDGSKVYMSDMDGDDVAEIHMGDVELGSAAGIASTGGRRTGGTYLWVGNSTKLLKFKVKGKKAIDFEVVTDELAGSDFLSVDYVNKKVFVSGTAAGKIQSYDYADKVLTTIVTTRFPRGVAAGAVDSSDDDAKEEEELLLAAGIRATVGENWAPIPLGVGLIALGALLLVVAKKVQPAAAAKDYAPI